ncbi:UNVERIFIED_CONTAM: class I heat shock protein [Sesamum calycinum]|uniref:Class I heat shock protein n=1 Tax=Sesamum calycinum TaxID=2727403 RepID=A0AAW2RQ53_9LAMI
MSLIPSFFGNRRSNVFDPFSLDIWDPFEGFPFSTTVANLPSSARETTAIANARIDWKETPEAHVFKVDVPGLKKEEVKVEVEDGTILQISGEKQRAGGEERQMAPRGEEQRKVPPPLQAAGECQVGSGEGGNGEWGADSHGAQGGGEEARG